MDGDSLTTIFAIFVAAILMFVFPLLAVSQNSDTASQSTVQLQTTEFVEKIRRTGKLTLDDYDKFVQTINNPNTYKIEIELNILDENPGVKLTQANRDKIGENIYYTMYTNQILDRLDNDNHLITLKKGDMVSVKVSNTNITIAQTLRNFLYRLAGNNASTINASHSGIITSDGSSN